MKLERINQVLLNESDELLLCLESGGQPMYQYVYREAAGVYWDSEFIGIVRMAVLNLQN